MENKYFIIEIGPGYDVVYESIILNCPIFNESNVFLANVVTDHFKIIPVSEEEFEGLLTL